MKFISTQTENNRNTQLFSEAITNFLQDRPILKQAVRDVFNDLYMFPSHHPSVAGRGVCLAVEAPFSSNHTLNVNRKSYLRQNYGEELPFTETTQEGTCYRATYGTACGVRTHGTPPRYVSFTVLPL